jgi:hypothetical protein
MDGHVKALKPTQTIRDGVGAWFRDSTSAGATNATNIANITGEFAGRGSSTPVNPHL